MCLVCLYCELQILHIALVFPLLILINEMPTEKTAIKNQSKLSKGQFREKYFTKKTKSKRNFSNLFETQILIKTVLENSYWLETEFIYNRVYSVVVPRVFDFSQSENQQFSLISFSNSF